MSFLHPITLPVTMIRATRMYSRSIQGISYLLTHLANTWIDTLKDNVKRLSVSNLKKKGTQCGHDYLTYQQTFAVHAKAEDLSVSDFELEGPKMAGINKSGSFNVCLFFTMCSN